MRALPFLLAVAACAAPLPERAHRYDGAELLTGRTAGAPQSCVAADQLTSLRILDARSVGFERGRILWVSRLPRDCPGLRADDRLSVEMHGREYCRDDRFSVVPAGSAQLGPWVGGPVCTLGEFVPYRRSQ
jgi:hypothetical protein